MFVSPFSSAFHIIPGWNNFIPLMILPETMNTPVVLLGLRVSPVVP